MNTALAATTALAQTTVQPAAGQQPFPTVIPSQISLCYANASINGRHFRMPQSIDNLVALIRKVEAHPDTALWTPGKMAVTLLHRWSPLIHVHHQIPSLRQLLQIPL